MKKIGIALVLSLGVLLSGCTDVLEKNPTNEIASGNVWGNEELCEQGVNAIYQALRNPVHSKTGNDADRTALVGESRELGYYAWEAFGMTGQTRLDAGGVFSGGVNASNPNFEYTWKWCFTGINRAADAIYSLPGADIGEELKGRYMGEARTLRAYFYMRLNELFGRGIGVPIYEYVVNPTNAQMAQSSESEVWDFIINDLTEAINSSYFPDNTLSGSLTGRVSKGTAYALRGRAYLLSSMSLGEDRYAQAIADFERVQAMGYGLFTGGYAELFKVRNEDNNEMLLYVQNIESPVGSAYGSFIQKYAAPYNAGAANSGGCWTDFQITPAIVDLYEVIVDAATCKPFDWEDYIPDYTTTPYNDRMVYFIRDRQRDGQPIHSTITTVVNTAVNNVSSNYRVQYLAQGNEARIRAVYENRDPRLEASVITPYSEFTGISRNSGGEASTYVSRWPVSGKYYTTDAGSETSLVGIPTSLAANGNQYFYYMFRKFIGEGVEYALREQNPVDEPILRYADVLLMWAEALVERNDLAGAKAKVQEVRNRVGMPTMDQYFTSQETARNYVRDERRREFVGEGVNFFDEMRWRTLRETKFEYGPGSSMQVWGGIATGAPEYVWTDAWYTWPVPKAESELNTMLRRTPGWVY